MKTVTTLLLACGALLPRQMSAQTSPSSTVVEAAKLFGFTDAEIEKI